MKQNQTLLIIVGIAIVLLLGNQLGLFSIGSFDFTKDVSWNEIDAEVYSTMDFGHNTIDIYQSSCDDMHQYLHNIITVPDNELSISLSGYITQSHSGGCGPENTLPAHTIIQTNNLNFSTTDLDYFEIMFQHSGSLSCPDNEASYGIPSTISLIGDNKIILFTSEGTQNMNNPSVSRTGKITITKDSGDDYILNFLGETNLITIPEGEYELELNAEIKIACNKGGGSASENIKITSLILEKEEQIEEIEEIEDETETETETDDTDTEDADTDDTGDLGPNPTVFDLQNVLFEINGFEVTFLYLIIIIGGILLIVIFKK